MLYGADYNPDQWPEEVWDEDVRLMREARVNIVSLGIFAWSRIQPSEDVWDFEWLDRVIEKLHEGGIQVNLATATASPPPWVSARYPDTLPADESGASYWPGSRQHFAPSSPTYRRLAGSSSGASPSATPSIPPSSCGTSATSSAATFRWTSRMPRATRTAPGCASATRRSTPSTRPGARTSGRSATPRSARSSRRAWRRTVTTRPRCSTSADSPPTCCSSAT